jgi:hypothetical protein
VISLVLRPSERFSQTPCHWVDSEQQLRALAATLEASTEFAVDLEVRALCRPRSSQSQADLMLVLSSSCAAPQLPLLPGIHLLDAGTCYPHSHFRADLRPAVNFLTDFAH